MELNGISPVISPAASVAAQTQPTEAQRVGSGAKIPEIAQDNNQVLTKKDELSKGDVKNVVSALNKFMQVVNADIQFAMHEKTETLMVQIVDVKEKKVLREFPSHELLDTLARIREYVGVLLDKKV